nr:MAG TPA: hypothetical protein [Caudoviricetes sp.]
MYNDTRSRQCWLVASCCDLLYAVYNIFGYCCDCWSAL